MTAKFHSCCHIFPQNCYYTDSGARVLVPVGYHEYICYMFLSHKLGEWSPSLGVYRVSFFLAADRGRLFFSAKSGTFPIFPTVCIAVPVNIRKGTLYPTKNKLPTTLSVSFVGTLFCSFRRFLLSSIFL